MSADYLNSLAHEFGSGTGSIRVRNLRFGESLPSGLDTGFNSSLDPDWVWIAEKDCAIQAVLLAAPFHGYALIGRVVASPEANPVVVSLLLRWTLRALRERGFWAYMSWLDPTREEERQLIAIVRKSKGVVRTEPQIVVGGPTNVEELLICRSPQR